MTANTGPNPRVCIVTRDYLSATPRVVKEADALHDAGFDVRVVFSQGGNASKRQHDTELLTARAWRWTAVRFSRDRKEFKTWAWSALRQRICQRMPSTFWGRGRIVECADGRVVPELVRAALLERADLYLGHYMPGLSAAAEAAHRAGASLGFDAEDLHVGEGNDPAETRRSDFIQRRYLPRCIHVSASSEGIADSIGNSYGIRTPITIHNVFPWSDRAKLDGARRDRTTAEFSIYWYSQTIGLDRGIQDAIKAMSRLNGPVQLHLRGTVSAQTQRSLLQLAHECGVASQIHFHPQVSPAELLSRAAEHDVGLAAEQGHNANRAVCATNKLFLYMLAGLAVAATRVPGQLAVLQQVLNGSAMYAPGDYMALAASLDRWRTSPHQLEQAKAAMLEAARRRWNWELESQRLVGAVDDALADRRPPEVRNGASDALAFDALGGR